MADGAAGTDGALCGWRVRSELPLPELAPWSGDDIPADVVIRFGAAPVRLEQPVLETPFVQIDAAKRCLLTMPQVARYFLADAREIVIAPAPGASEEEIRLFLLGTMFGLLCHKRGLFPLHASCVMIGSGAFAFAGNAGAGKSTMAALFAKRGFEVLADDVCVIDTADGVPVVLPSFPRLKLWRDCLDALAIASDGLQRIRPALQKYSYPLQEKFHHPPAALQAVVVIRRMTGPMLCERLGTVAALQMLRKLVFRLRLAHALDSSQALFAAETRIISTVPVFQMFRPLDFSRAEDGVDRILALLAL